MRQYGIVQLFSSPHPSRAREKYFHNEEAPKLINRSRLHGDQQFVKKVIKNIRSTQILFSHLKLKEDNEIKVKYSSFTPTYENEILKKKYACLSYKIDRNLSQILKIKIQKE